MRSSHSNCRFLYMPDRVSPDHPAEGSAAPPKGGWQFRCCWKQRNDMPPWSTPWSVQRLSLFLSLSLFSLDILALNKSGNGNDGATIANTTCSRKAPNPSAVPILAPNNRKRKWWRHNRSPHVPGKGIDASFPPSFPTNYPEMAMVVLLLLSKCK